MKVFIDTNVFLRFLIEDESVMHKQALNLIKRLENAEIRPYTSTIVFLEVLHVITKFYKIPKLEALESVRKLTELKNLTIIEKTNFRKAILLYEKYSVKLADLIIALQVPEECGLCTFDKEFKKLDFVKSYTPSEI
uniref:Type II toxin-antitoxin system VapC family toxin n=1 Tax=candidate division WWE3 bacterium TaxID=2053526 RepID=A0A7C4XN86_UNCKA